MHNSNTRGSVIGTTRVNYIKQKAKSFIHIKNLTESNYNQYHYKNHSTKKKQANRFQQSSTTHKNKLKIKAVTQTIITKCFTTSTKTFKTITNLSTDKTAESKGGEMAVVHTILIQMAYIDLNRSVVLSGNQPVGGWAAFIIPLISQNPITKHSPKTNIKTK